jgi:hypothetical protein
MRNILLSSSLAALLSTGCEASRSRLGQPQQNNRELQNPATQVLNALVETFLPAVVNELENNIADDLDPILLDLETVEEVEVISDCLNITSDEGFSEAVSRSDADEETFYGNVTYTIGEMTGMSTMSIESVVLQAGSQEIKIPAMAIFGAQGSTWGGVWDAVASFDELGLATNATLNMTDFCDVSYTEVLTGTFVIHKPVVTMTIYAAGETDNIYRFNDQSVVNVATVQSMSMTYEKVTGNLGYFDEYAGIDADAIFLDLASAELAPGSPFFDLIIGFVQQEVDKEIPFSL